MTFNIRTIFGRDPSPHSWPERMPRVVQTIKDHDPLLFGVQEAQRQPMLSDLESALTEYAWVGQGRGSDLEDEHCAIFYKKAELAVVDQGQFWLSETPNEPGSLGWDASFPRICTWVKFRSSASPAAEFLVFNTHLDHMGQQARKQGIRTVFRFMKEQSDLTKLPVILMGDFNSEPSDPVIRYVHGLEHQGDEYMKLTDVFDFHQGPVGSTFHDFQGGTEGEPIDYIFVSPSFTIRKVQIDRSSYNGAYPSDHYPVIAELELG